MSLAHRIAQHGARARGRGPELVVGQPVTGLGPLDGHVRNTTPPVHDEGLSIKASVLSGPGGHAMEVVHPGELSYVVGSGKASVGT